MEKELRVLAGIGLVSIAVFAIGQIEVAPRTGSTGGLPTGGSRVFQPIGQGFADRATGPAQNAAVYALRKSIAGQLNLVRQRALADGNRELASQMIKVNCWAVLAAMTPAQQRYEIDHVWRLSHFKPDDEWDRVAAAPSMVDALLKVNSETLSKIDAILAEGSKRRMKPYDEFNARMKALAKSTGQSQQSFHNDRLKGYVIELAEKKLRQMGRPEPGLTHEAALVVLTEASNRDYASDVSKIRALLSGEQVAEWTRIERASIGKAEAILAGANPFAVGK